MSDPAEKVEKWDIEKLIPYARNARTHSDEQVGQIAASIKEWGWTTPVLVDEDGGIIAGHGRTMAAKRLGLREVPVMVARGWSDAKKRAYVLADNKLALNAGWDDSMLALELKELGEIGFDLDLTGFSLDEIAALTPVEVKPGLTDEDAVPEAPEEPTTRLGDVWILGQHRLMCGDSTSIDAVEKLMDGQLAEAIVTDPPYGIGIDGQKESKSKNPKHNRKSHDFRGWDDERPDEGIFNYIVALNVPSVIWGGNYFADILPATRGWIYWSKGQDGLTMSDGELAWTTESTPLRSVTVNRAALQGSVHPTQKPLKIIEYSLEYIKAGKVVLDLFGGSGSTLIACEKTARQCRMMELDPKYCDVIIKRWQDYTGKNAINSVCGREFKALQKQVHE
jgi:hypothetical protein